MVTFSIAPNGGIDSTGSTGRKYGSGRKHTTHTSENTDTIELS